MNQRLIPLFVAMLMAVPGLVQAGVGAELVKGGSKLVVGQTAKQGARLAARSAAQKTTQQIIKGSAAATAARMTASATRHFGDDAVKAGSRFLDDLARINARVTGRQQRRLAMMGKEFAKSGQAQTVVSKLSASSTPGKLIDDLWARRVPLAAAAATATVMIHGGDIAIAAGNSIAKPIIESVIIPVAETAVSLVSVLLIAGLMIVLAIMIGWYMRISNISVSVSKVARWVMRTPEITKV